MSYLKNSNLKYEKLSKKNTDDYEAFLKQFGSTLIYHTEPFLRTLIKSFGFQQETIILKNNDQIQAVLPLLSMEGELGTVFNSLPFFGSYGGIYSLNKSSYDNLVKAFNDLRLKNNFLSNTIIQNPFQSFNKLDFNYTYEDIRIAQFTNIDFLSDHKENLFKIFHSNTRRNIRKSEKFKIDIYIDINKIRDLYELHKVDISKKKGIFKPLKFFMNLIEIIPPENIKLYVAYIDGKFAAGLLLLYYNKTVEYITPVINEEYKSYQVLSKIIFEAMVDASIKGFKIWNWGGTWIEQESVHRFKKRWGSKQLTYSYLTTVNKNKLLNYKRDFILKKYPFSYVLPFDKL